MHNEDTYQQMAGSEPGVSSQPPYVPNEEYYRQQQKNQPNTKARLGIALLLVGLMWLGFELLGRNLVMSGSGSEGILLEETFNGTSIVMEVGSSDVDIQSWDENSIRIEARYSGGSPEDYTIDIEQQRNGIRVSEVIAPCFGIGFCSRDLDYNILLPRNGNVDLQTSSGDVVIADINGEIQLSTASGNIDATNLTQGLAASTQSGDVSLDVIAGMLDISTASGNVELDSGQITDARVKTVSGEIELEGVSNDLVLESISGNITVQDAQNGRLNIQNTSGNIEFTGSLADAEQHTINSVSGNVELRLPEDTGFSLQADTLTGDIDNEFAAQNIRRDGSALRINTVSGNIDLASW